MRRYSILAIAFGLATLIVLSGCNQAQSPSDQSAPGSGQSAAGAAAGGIRIEKPFQQQLAGAECYSGGGKSAGNVGFGFPSRSKRVLAFTLGPLRDNLSPGQENNKPYDGAGAYPNIGIALKSPNGKSIVGFGTITVNPDLQSGTFVLNDGSAAGTWDCGHKL